MRTVNRCIVVGHRLTEYLSSLRAMAQIMRLLFVLICHVFYGSQTAQRTTFTESEPNRAKIQDVAPLNGSSLHNWNRFLRDIQLMWELCKPQIKDNSLVKTKDL